ncbi:MAG: hypothetical protein H5T97_10585 [Firmicutes bacterium]|nr:hypothetical protein [Bacillota bacterium]
MDQAVEAALVTCAFITAVCLAYSVTAALYASAVSAQLAPGLDSAASIVASTIAAQNGNSSSAWSSWTPPQDPTAYGLPQGTALYVNATCFAVDANSGQVTVLWSKATPTPIAGAAGTANRFIIMDDGTAVRLDVRVR